MITNQKFQFTEAKTSWKIAVSELTKNTSFILCWADLLDVRMQSVSSGRVADRFYTEDLPARCTIYRDEMRTSFLFSFQTANKASANKH